MTTIKISQLPSITGANAATDDVLPLVDTSLNTTNKITRQEFFLNTPPISVTGDITIGDKIIHSGDINTAIRFPAADTVTVETGGVERFKIDSLGFAAFGQTAGISPALGLEITIPTTSDFRSVGVTSPTYTTDFKAAFIRYNGAAVTGTTAGLSNADLGQLAFVNNSAGLIRTNSASPLVFATTNTERMRIDSSGNVGIGTTSPATALDVIGDVKVGSTTVAADRSVSVHSGTADRTYLVRFSSGEGHIRHQGTGALRNVTEGAAPIIFVTNSNERARIDSNGRLAIGNTSPIAPLHVTGATVTTGVVYKNQPAQTSKAAAATLTIAELLTGIVQYTGAAANLTLPTGTSIEGGVPATFPTDMSFDFSVINTGSGAATVVTNTGLTLTGGMTVAAGDSGMFRVRKTATNTYTVYRIS